MYTTSMAICDTLGPRTTIIPKSSDHLNFKGGNFAL